jgi:hypothetical protein
MWLSHDCQHCWQQVPCPLQKWQLWNCEVVCCLTLFTKLLDPRPYGPPPRGRGGHQAPSGLVTKLTLSFPSSIICPSLLPAPSPVFASPLNPLYIPAAFPLSCPSASNWPYHFPLFHLHLFPHPNGVRVSWLWHPATVWDNKNELTRHHKMDHASTSNGHNVMVSPPVDQRQAGTMPGPQPQEGPPQRLAALLTWAPGEGRVRLLAAQQPRRQY